MSSQGAMTGLRVIDLTRVLGGPYCTQILADHGADVIKVEPPAGDEVRDWGPPFHEEDAAYFVGINRNKRSIGLALASEGGRAVLLKMLETADVLIENFKPGTLDKWGIGNDVLREKFPKLVHCRISGFGADGPRGGNPGYDAIIQAMTGMISATGSPESGPMRTGVPVVGLPLGLYAASGILMALSGRPPWGLAPFVETTLSASWPARRRDRCRRSTRRSTTPTPSTAAISSRKIGTRASPRRSGWSGPNPACAAPRRNFPSIRPRCSASSATRRVK